MFKYYVYISDAKVDMMLSQIDPGFARVRETEAKAGVSMLGFSRKVTDSRSDRIVRLERVLRHLQDYGDIGAVDEPGQFFGGILPMRMSVLGPETVYFGGATEWTEVGLGGSPMHLEGPAISPPDAVQAGPGSHAAGILNSLITEIGEENGREGAFDDDEATSRAVRDFNRSLRSPLQNVEILAKRLAHVPSPTDGQAVLLGSPLYVALAD